MNYAESPEAANEPEESRIAHRQFQARASAGDLTTVVVRELERREIEAMARDGFRPPERRRDRRRRIANKQGFRKPPMLEIPRASPLLAPLSPIEFSQALDEVHHELSEELS
jgi:hypothetical protein